MSVERFESMMKDLYEIPKVQEHMNKLPVQLAEQISTRRIRKGLTQANVVDLVRKNGGSLTQAQLSRIETGNENVSIQTYQKVLDVLDFNNLDLHFKNGHKDKKLVRTHKELAHS